MTNMLTRSPASQEPAAAAEGSLAGVSVACLLVSFVGVVVLSTLRVFRLPWLQGVAPSIVLTWIAFAPVVSHLYQRSRRLRVSAAPGTILLVAYSLIPFLGIPLLNSYPGSDGVCPFLVQDQTYYLANGRAVFEHGNGLLGPNPFDTDPNTPVIYFHWLTWLMGFALAKLDLRPETVQVGLLLTSGAAFAGLTLVLIRQLVPAEHCARVFLLLMFAGSIFSIAGLIFAPRNNPLAYDPLNGWWFLQWGRNLMLPTEATYHSLVLLSWIAVLQHRRRLAAISIAAVAATHPFTGAEHLAILGLFMTALLWQDRDRQTFQAWLILLMTSIVFAGYYFAWLPSFGAYRAIVSNWTEIEAFSVSWPTVLLAWGPVLLLAITGHCLRQDSDDEQHATRSREPDLHAFRRLMAMTAGVAFLLSQHDLVMRSHQPIHFTRGYVWFPLALIGLPALVALLERIRIQRSSLLSAVLLSTLFVIVSLDNIIWLGGHYHRPVDSQLMLKTEHRDVILHLKDNEPKGVVLSTSAEIMRYLPVYSRIQSYIGHSPSTPDIRNKKARLKAFFFEGEPVPAVISTLVIRKRELGRFPAVSQQFEATTTVGSYLIMKRRPIEHGVPK